MHLHALYVVRDRQRPTAVVNVASVGQKLEIPLDYAGEAVRPGDTQTEAGPKRLHGTKRRVLPGGKRWKMFARIILQRIRWGRCSTFATTGIG